MNRTCLVAVCTAAGLGSGIWLGRTMPPEKSSSGNPAREVRSGGRAGDSRTGGSPVTTAAELRGLFRRAGASAHGKGAAEAALGSMSGAEIAALVKSLEAEQAANPAYRYTAEIAVAFKRWGELDPDGALKFALQSKQTSFRNVALDNLFSGLAVIDPDLARAKSSAIEDPTSRNIAWRSVFNAIGASDPDGWIAMMKQDPTLGSGFGSMNTSVASEWAVDDPVAAAARVAMLPASMRKDAVAAVAKIWGAKDAMAALAWAKSLEDPTQRTRALAEVAGGMAAKDPGGAIASLDGALPAVRKAGLSSIFEALADVDFDAALARAGELADPADQQAAFGPLAKEISGFYADPEKAFALLSKLPEGNLKNDALSGFGQSLYSLSDEQADALIERCPEADRERIRSQMEQYLVYFDPERALRFRDSSPDGKASGASFGQIIAQLAGRDPLKAFELSQARKNPGEQEQGMRFVFGQLAQSDPAAAQARLAELPAGAGRTSAIVALSAAWAESDPAAAKAWAQSLGGEEKQNAITALTPVIAQTDPKEAAAMLLPFATAGGGENTTLNSAVGRVCGAWVTKDPEAAGNWISGLPDGSVKERAVGIVTWPWCQKDPEAAANWVDSLPEGKAKDNGATGIVMSVAGTDPGVALQWATAIGDTVSRSTSLRHVVTTWKGTNPEAARAAVEGAGLGDTERGDLLRILDAKGPAVPLSEYYDPFEE